MQMKIETFPLCAHFMHYAETMHKNGQDIQF
jgi:hypothetical protein